MTSWRRTMDTYGIPVISLALSCMLWYYVVNQKVRSWSYSAPVYVKTASADIAGWSIPEKVSVELKGPNRILDRISGDQIGLKIELAEIQAGQYTRSIQPSMITGIPAGVEIVRIEPAEVRIELRPLLEIRYRVAPEFVENADTTVKLGSVIDVDPKYVELRGVREILQDVTEVKTEPIDVTGPAGRRDIQARLIAPEGARIYPQSARVMFEIVPASESGTAGR